MYTPTWFTCETADWGPAFRRAAGAHLCANDFANEPEQLAIERRRDGVR